MNKSDVLTALHTAVALKQRQYMRWAKKHNNTDAYMDELSKLDITNVTNMRYQPRKGMFTSNNGNCGLNPETMEGHSYEWYSLVKLVKGTVLLNTFCYSNQTSKHINKMRNVLQTLSVAYKSVQAPQGLQDLERAVRYHVEQHADAIVKYRHARIKDTRDIQRHSDALATLAMLGYSYEAKTSVDAIRTASEARSRRLEFERNKRREAKIKNTPLLKLVEGVGI